MANTTPTTLYQVLKSYTKQDEHGYFQLLTIRTRSGNQFEATLAHHKGEGTLICFTTKTDYVHIHVDSIESVSVSHR